MLWTCCECRERAKKETMIEYKSKKYCNHCYELKLEKERFVNYVCKLFGIKSPGPIIYSQRKRLKEIYGYTDDVLIKTLSYLFEVKGMNRAYETLGLINPINVDEALKYYKNQKINQEQILRNIEKSQKDIKVITIPLNKKKEDKKDIDVDKLFEGIDD